MSVMTMVYLLEYSIFDVFRTGLLRRVICILPFLRELRMQILKNRRIRMLPAPFAFLLFPLVIQCLQCIPSVLTAYMRTAFWLVWLYVMHTHIAEKTHEEIKELYTRFAWIFVLVHTAGCLYAWNRYSGNGDWTGMYENRNMTVSLSMSSAALCLFLRERTPGISCVLMCSSLLFAFRTGSRMAAVLSIVLLYALLRERPKLIAVLPVLVCLPMPASWNRLVSDGSSAGLFRDTWQIGIRLFLERPLLGHGMHTAYYYTFVENSGGWGWGTHNSWLVILAENGLIGASCYAVFFTSVFRKIRSGLKDPSVRTWYRNCLILLVITAVNAGAESFLFSPGNVMSLPFWFTVLCICEDRA
ncbi:MAG: O-antigen ligase family protein [Solobacterium sp.]|nr:O-antigen ligase family protein [Solobacterium sp.]